jgi:hypothetical protein
MMSKQAPETIAEMAKHGQLEYIFPSPVQHGARASRLDLVRNVLCRRGRRGIGHAGRRARVLASDHGRGDEFFSGHPALGTPRAPADRDDHPFPKLLAAQRPNVRG